MNSGNRKRAKKDSTEVRLFKKYIKTLFNVYDADNSGFLDLEELRDLLDDLRESMFLPKTDDYIFTKILNILDEDKNSQIEQQEFNSNIQNIFIIVQECGNEKADEIKEIFDEYDFDDIGRIHRKNVYPFFNDFANMEVIFVYNKYQNIPDLEIWHVDYIISVIDDNYDGYLEYEEVIANYSKIIKSMLQLTKTDDVRTQKHNDSGANNIFFKINSKIEEKQNEEKLKKGSSEYENTKLIASKNLDHMNRYQRQQTRALIPVSNQVNRRASINSKNRSNDHTPKNRSNGHTPKSNSRLITPENTRQGDRTTRLNAFVTQLTMETPKNKTIKKETLGSILEDDGNGSETSLSDDIVKQIKNYEYQGSQMRPTICVSPSRKQDIKNTNFSPLQSATYYSKEFKIKSNKVEKKRPVSPQIVQKSILMERMKTFGFGYNKCKDEDQKKTHSKKFFEEFTKDDILSMAQNAKFVKQTYDKLLRRINIFIDSLKDFLTYKIENKQETTNKENTNCFNKGEHVPFEFGAPIDNATKPVSRRIVMPEELIQLESNISMEKSTRNIKKLFNYDPIETRIKQRQNNETIKSHTLQVSIDKIRKHVLRNMDDEELAENLRKVSLDQNKNSGGNVIRKSFFLRSTKKNKTNLYNTRKSVECCNKGRSVEFSDTRKSVECSNTHKKVECSNRLI